MNPQTIARKIVAMVADGRLIDPLIESVGYWTAQYSAGSEVGNKILTLAHSIIDNIKEHHANREQS